MHELTREELLKKLTEVGFAAVDLNLFLDTHPHDQNALADYNYIVQELEYLTKLWECTFGPLMNQGMSASEYPWHWVDDPWPWEKNF